MSTIHSPLRDHEESPAAFIAIRLSEISTNLSAQWSVLALERRGPAGSYPAADQALPKLIPPIVGSIARYVRNPDLQVRREILAQVWTDGDAWRQLDFSASDLIAWLDGLSRLIMQRMQQEIARSEQVCSAQAAIEAFTRLSDGLRDMTSVILGLYLDREADRYQVSALQQVEAAQMFAHEMRGPLHAISLSADALDATGPANDPNRYRHVRVIRSALAHAESLLQHTDVAERAVGPQFLGLTAPVQGVLESVVDELNARALAAGVELRVAGSAPLLAVETVVARIVLSNLVINAIKYSDHAKERRWVTVTSEIADGDDPRFVTVEVADNGIGIPASLQEHLFQRRFRAHPQVAAGHGLGLAIARDVLAGRGGSIDLISNEQIGTAVRFRLPASPIEAKQVAMERDGRPEAHDLRCRPAVRQQQEV